MEYTWQPVYDIISIVIIRYYTEIVIQIFRTYTETCICCYIGIISGILTDSYRVNKREYGLHVFKESLYNDVRESYSKTIQDAKCIRIGHYHDDFKSVKWSRLIFNLSTYCKSGKTYYKLWHPLLLQIGSTVNASRAAHYMCFTLNLILDKI